MPQLNVVTERFPIQGSFTISRGSKTEAAVVMAEIRDGNATGRGECVPYARYGESVEGVMAAIEGVRDAINAGITRQALQSLLPSGAARNALDCALWDLEAKRTGRRAFEIAGLPAPQPVTTAYTISLDTPEAMAQAAREAARPLLKLKLGTDGDVQRIRAIHAAVPESELIVDANEGWTPANLAANLDACAQAGVLLVEQPLPADNDAALADIPHTVPICADESAHDRAGLHHLIGRYDAINIKLDKTGGLTEALGLAQDARAAGLQIM
ncbi:MAG TPA: dipeptide epimerase, partial [Ancylobacter sp.]